MPSATPEFITEIVRAGAGAGKTWSLTEKTIEIVEQYLDKHKRLPKLVITTFTKKATEELRERITRRALAAKNEKVLEIVKSRQYLQISTIHGVLSGFLRSYGHLAGIESEFTIVDQTQSANLGKKVLREILKRFPNEFRAFDQLSFESLLIACLSYRRARMAAGEITPFCQADYEEAVQLIFKPLIQEVRSTINAILEETQEAKWIEYLNLLKAQLDDLNNLESGIRSIGRRPTFKEAHFSAELSERLSTGVDRLKKMAARSFLDRSVWSGIEKCTTEFTALGQLFLAEINKIKSETGVFDSEDLELFSMDVLRREPDLGNAFAAEWDYWLVDEYQDTSPSQVEILNRLVGDSPCFYVGDPQQSIYLFRGARTEVFASREQAVLDQGGIKSELAVNRRSRPELLIAINDCIQELGKEFYPMTPRSEEIDSEFEAIQVFKAPADSDNPYSDLTAFVQQEIGKGAKPDDFCVLSRTNKILKEVANQFESCGIPCAVHSAEGFFSRREVLDLMSLYKFLWNPFDHHNLLRLLRSPWFCVSDEQIAQWSADKFEHFWMLLKSKYADHPIVERLGKAHQKVSQIGLSETFMQTAIESKMFDLSHWHDPTGRRESNMWKLFLWLKRSEKTPGFKPAAVCRHFERAVRGFDEESDATASKEPNRVNLMTVHKSKGLSFKYVILPNMEKVPRFSSARAHEQPLHFDETRSKFGLCTYNNATLVHSPSIHLYLQKLEQREREENQRLLYVALTRAEEQLIFHALEGSRGFSRDSWAGQLNVWNPDRNKDRSKKYRIVVHQGQDQIYRSFEAESTKPRHPRSQYQWKSDQSGGRRFSVSSLIESDSESMKANSREKKTVDSLRLQVRAPSFGTVIHRAFEDLRFNEVDTVLQRMRQFLGEDFQKVAAALNYTIGLEAPPMQDLLKVGHVEWGFQLKTASGILEGQIDLWGEVDDVVWLIDYKSGSARYVDKAFEQLKVYAYALSQSFGFQKFKLAVVYPLSQKCEIRPFEDCVSTGRKFHF